MKKWNYYNEIDASAAQWVRELIAAGLIPAGEVDERDIRDVVPDDVRSFVQCHWFCGIAGWPYALRLAGWPDDRPVWTGSCPCQPFSQAGQGGGFADERHLWPDFHWLIEQCRPPVVFGEQVASKDGLVWLDLVSADLEGSGYAFGATDLCAPGAGLDGLGPAEDEWLQRAILDCPDPLLADELRNYAEWARGALCHGPEHIRQRLFWMADAMRGRAEHLAGEGMGAETAADRQDGHLPRQRLRPRVEGATRNWMADSLGERLERRDARAMGLECATAERGGATGRMGQSDCAGSLSRDETAAPARHGGSAIAAGRGPWSDLIWLPCRDGKARPTARTIEPTIQWMADGLPGDLGRVRTTEESHLSPLATGVEGRVVKLRGYGNAIVPQVAAAFIAASLTPGHGGGNG